MSEAIKPRVYLAGPDVFMTNALEHAAYLKQLCADAGLEGVFPLDSQIPDNIDPDHEAGWIARCNMGLIRSCSAVLANLNSFRGIEPDSGTVFEVGFAIALGIPVWVYFEGKGDLRDQVPHSASGHDDLGMLVEDFGLPRNLMLACTWAGYSCTAKKGIKGLSRYMYELKEAQTV